MEDAARSFCAVFPLIFPIAFPFRFGRGFIALVGRYVCRSVVETTRYFNWTTRSGKNLEPEAEKRVESLYTIYSLTYSRAESSRLVWSVLYALLVNYFRLRAFPNADVMGVCMILNIDVTISCSN